MNEFPKEHILVRLCRDQGYERVAEIGVFGGNLTERVVGTLLKEKRPIKKYYCIDPWIVYIEHYHRPPHEREKDPEYWENLYQKTVEVSNRYPEIVEITRAKSVDASAMYRKNGVELDVVYVDSIHDEKHLVQDVYGWLPMIRNDGAISGHDYIKTFEGMAKALDVIFEDKLNLMIIDPSKPAISLGNTAQGGNWWVWITEEMRTVWMERIEKLYPEHIKDMK